MCKNLSFLFAILLCLSYSEDLWAQVASTDTIYVDVNATGLNNGSSWANAYTSIDSVNTQSLTNNNLEVWVAQGRYVHSTSNSSLIVRHGLHVYGGFQGGETNRADRDHRAYITILDGDVNQDDSGALSFTNSTRSDNARSVVVMWAEGDSSTAIRPCLLDGFVVENGNAPSATVLINRYGAGIYVYAPSDAYSTLLNTAIIRNCIVQNNTAVYNTAIITDAEYSSNPVFSVVENCIVRNNAADGNAAFSVRSRNAVSSSVVSNSLFYENRSDLGASMSVGLEINSQNFAFPAVVVFTNCTISDNTRPAGKAVLNVYTNAATTTQPNNESPSRASIYNSIINEGQGLLLTNTGQGTADTCTIGNSWLSTNSITNLYSPQGQGNIVANTSANFFTDASTGDYRISSATAPVVGLGSKASYLEVYDLIWAAAPERDLAGNNRYSSSSNSMSAGAYEYTPPTGTIASERPNWVRVAPNPSEGFVQLQTALDIQSVRVLDLNGRVLREFGANTQSLDLSTLASGVYLVEVQTDAGKQVEKLVLR